ncbi:hypothetical protein DL766_006939 [Monosporascus sp. MC13-8B]|nr:hypothetical protein DL763_003120 [Monosporascus cannonballus]RYP25755.1 hypothetical protein DL766_006939 [Monosporascus sp. MC13-8B]
MTSPKKPELTEPEQRVLSNAWLFMKSAPDVDVERLSQALGYTNARSCSNVLSKAKKKIAEAAAAAAAESGEAHNAAAGPTTPTKPSPAKAAKPGGSARKRKAAVGGDLNDGPVDAPSPSPAKRGRGQGHKKAAPKPAEMVDDNDVDDDLRGGGVAKEANQDEEFVLEDGEA